MSTSDSLLSAIEAFCQRHGMSETAFGIQVARDGHLVRRLRRTKSMTLRRMEQVETFMASVDRKKQNAAQPPNPSADVEETHAPEAAA